MIVKLHEGQGKKVISICDNDILGKTFEEEELQLDVKESFYKGEEMDEEQIKEILKDADSLILVGEESINLGLKLDLITEEHIKKVQNIPHAQCIFTK